MMSLTKTWASYFKSRVRMRGRAYQAAGRVRQIEPSDGELVRAEVRGQQTYTVVIHGDGPHASVECTCPHFAEGAYCKHLWATLLDVQYNGYKYPPGQGDGAQPIEHASPPPPKARKRSGADRAARRSEPDWLARLNLLRRPGFAPDLTPPMHAGAQRQICYVVNPELSIRHQGLVIELRQREASRRGWGRMKRLRISRSAVAQLADPLDRQMCALILGATWVDEYGTGYENFDDRARDAYRLLPGTWRTMLHQLIDTGRCFLDDGDDTEPLAWDGDEPWVVWLLGRRGNDALSVTVEFRRGQQQMNVEAPGLVLGGADGVVFYDNAVAPLDDRGAFRWVSQFRDDLRAHGQTAPIQVPEADIERFLDRMYMLAELPEIDLPTDVARPEVQMAPVPHLELHSPGPGAAATTAQAAGSGRTRGHLNARVWFAYDRHRVFLGQSGRYVVTLPGDDADAGVDPDLDQAPLTEDPVAAPAGDSALIRRDLAREREASALLASLGFRPDPDGGPDSLLLAPSRVPGVVSQLLGDGWLVTADKQLVRQAAEPKLSVRWHIDWFELSGTVRFSTEHGDQDVPLPQLLAAARQGRTMITLGDGSQGMLPQQWLADHGLLTTVGKLEDDHLRFRPVQAVLLDALLGENEVVDFDQRFAQMRQRLRQFDRVEPRQEPATFQGSLRNYQRDGLGWFDFLRWFRMGGILADDMGLGKTIQVLAMLDARLDEADDSTADSVAAGADAGGNGDGDGDGGGHGGDGGGNVPRRRPRPSLVVVPRSLVFNWEQEAQRFTPRLRVLAYTGPDRRNMLDHIHEYDAVVTSYGLLRRDITELRQIPFGYVVLDEAQAIKNPGSQSAKAARLLQAEHRLALTGTPVENHLGDLWSIVEFLNPGLLGSGARFAKLVRGKWSPRKRPESADAGAPNPPRRKSQRASPLHSVEVASQAGRALRPLILRRTKQQVLSELPAKTEQTIICEMESSQRKVYDELLGFYRASLLGKAAPGASDDAVTSGLGKSAMLVIEALLRLRQAACHPALIDPKRTDLPSAKLDVLMDDLKELIDEGHKALVFSQFTSMLALVKPRLEEAGIPYAYLDGQTQDRQACVERFQSDAKCPVFLISLKAGGFGLNLTAADYVFILDPWWNPAVEQQAIDRAHRIGQSRPVFAYRLVCRDTVEQRIIELQTRKKELADAIIAGQENVLRSLTREDLNVLLS